MANPRIEEVSDSDPEIEDPSSFLPSDSIHALQPASTSETSKPTPSSSSSAPREPNPTLFRPPPPAANPQNRDMIKHYCTLYPLYFDSTRTRAQGRRVSSEHAIANPLAYNIITALRDALAPHHLPLTLEPDKTHPKDWANPGRVRVQLFNKEDHRALHPTIKSKAALYNLVGKELQRRPTDPKDPLQLKIPGVPVPENFLEDEVPKPRGWKMNGILPVHSAAVSGGGVSDNFFKEAMEEMKQAQASGQLPPGMGGGAGAGGGGGGMPDMSQLQAMMQGMGGMGGLGGPGGGGGGGAGTGGKKGKKKG